MFSIQIQGKVGRIERLDEMATSDWLPVKGVREKYGGTFAKSHEQTTIREWLAGAYRSIEPIYWTLEDQVPAGEHVSQPCSNPDTC